MGLLREKVSGRGEGRISENNEEGERTSVFKNLI